MKGAKALARKKDGQPEELEQEKQDGEIVEEATQDAAATTEPQPAEPTPTEKLESQLQEEKDRYLRLMAEFDNFRRRSQKEKESIYPDAVADTLKELLPMLDNFQRALAAPCTDAEYKKGVQMIYDGFMEILRKQGLCEFGQAGEPFDPTLHNAIMHVDDDALEKNVIAQVFQPGYKIGDKVIRFAMVQQAN